MKVLYYVVCALVLLFLVAPVFVVIPISFSGSPYLEFPPSSYSLRWYREFFEIRTWHESMLNSFKVASITMLVTVLLGTASAFGLADSRVRGARVFQALLLLPMLVPHIVIAI